MTGQEWRITPELLDGESVYTLYQPHDTAFVARCFPAKNFAVQQNLGNHPYELEFWHLSWPRRLTTLVESARIGEQVKNRKLLDDGDHTDSACSACGRSSEKYLPWGAGCERKGCPGKYFPAKVNPAR